MTILLINKFGRGKSESKSCAMKTKIKTKIKTNIRSHNLSGLNITKKYN